MVKEQRDIHLLAQPSGGVPDVIDTREGFDDFVDAFANASGAVAADAERASGYRYSQRDWLVQLKREGAGIALVDPVASGRVFPGRFSMKLSAKQSGLSMTAFRICRDSMNWG